MNEQHHRRAKDIGLRLGGAALCCVAWTALRMLVHVRLAAAAAAPGATAFALAALGFGAASAGAALCSLGYRLFDPVAVSQLWAAGSRDHRGKKEGGSGSAAGAAGAG